MDARTAKRVAHRWVADVIEHALGGGADDETFTALEPADAERLEVAIREIATGHETKSGPR